MHFIVSLASIFFLTCAASTYAAGKPESTCFGSHDKGKIENAWQLPSSGENFSAYSAIGTSAGRNYVHSAVYRVIIESYKLVHQRTPQTIFVYGETGWKNGGRFRPHKTHQNGLSVDFFVPVKDKNGRSVPIPATVFNKLGYNIEFNSQGQYKDLSIDFEAMAEHLLALKSVADRQGIKIWRVIFDNDLQKLLFQTSKGKDLQAQLTFSRKKPWVRHDEHYHVDFLVPCK